MRRKVSFVITAVMTVVFMILRWNTEALAAVSVGPFNLSDGVLALCLLTIAVIIILCVSKKATVIPLTGKTRGTINGWLCTFCGAIMAMSACLDVICWIVYQQVPPPNAYILNNIDLITLIASLLFGILGGVFLVMQGFSWMSGSSANSTLRGWMSLAPVLWMWFRLARYEISYASTIDISESFFDFAILIFASLFFLQLARTVSGVGAPPKNGLLICALCTGFIALSGAPATIAELAQGQPIGSLLSAVVDMVVGVFAMGMAVTQVFHNESAVWLPEDEEAAPVPTDEEAEVDLAWTEPERDLPPVEPAFEIDQVLPEIEQDPPLTEATPTPVTPTPVTPTPPAVKKAAHASLTVDDILTEIDSIE